MPVDHYENFPVASVLLPRRLRPAVEAIYAFARSADDLADEGDATPAQRLAALAAYEDELDRIAAGETPHTELFKRLADIVAAYRLPRAQRRMGSTPLYDVRTRMRLLSATRARPPRPDAVRLLPG